MFLCLKCMHESKVGGTWIMVSMSRTPVYTKCEGCGKETHCGDVPVSVQRIKGVKMMKKYPGKWRGFKRWK